MKLSRIAESLGARLDGADAEITGVAGIEEAGPEQITFVANSKYAAAARTTKAAAVIVTNDFPAIAAATLRCANPYLVFARAIGLFYQPPRPAAGIHARAEVHATAKIGKNATV